MQTRRSFSKNHRDSRLVSTSCIFTCWFIDQAVYESLKVQCHREEAEILMMTTLMTMLMTKTIGDRSVKWMIRYLPPPPRKESEFMPVDLIETAAIHGQKQPLTWMGLGKYKD